MHQMQFGRRGAVRVDSRSVRRPATPAASGVVARAEPLEARQLLSAVTSFTLINSQTDQPIQTLNNGATLNLGQPAGGEAERPRQYRQPERGQRPLYTGQRQRRH